jgi:ribosomal 30S subunit maturation factor RimM
LIGKVVDVIDIPASKLLEVSDGKKKFLIPLVDAFVKEITDNKIYIEEIEGLR